MNTKVIVCDLDGTLAESKSPLAPDMAKVIAKVLLSHRIAVISGASFTQFESQFLAHLECSPEQLANLYLFPVNGSGHYVYDKVSGKWNEVYMEKLSEEERMKIYDAFAKALQESDVDVYDPYGKLDIMEYRGGQITFSGRGQSAPLAEKQSWDPDEKKRNELVAILKKYIPEYEVRIGGATSIDVTQPGINKAYAIGKIEKYLGVKKEDMIFFGDALYEGGNDATVKETGVECVSVSGPQETIEKLARYAQN